MNRIDFCVREARHADLPAVAELEKYVWSTLGAPPISEDTLRKWLDMQSPFFLVAEAENTVAGYYFGQCNDFSLANADKYTKLDIVTGKGYINIEHDPDGNGLYGVTVASVMPGAGGALYTEVLNRWKNLKKQYYFGYCRLSGFSAYLASLNPGPRKSAEINLDETALWYAHACMEAIGGKIWDRCKARPVLGLPLPPPDPILSFHSKCCGGKFGLLDVIPRFMTCTESKGYAGFMVCETGG